MRLSRSKLRRHELVFVNSVTYVDKKRTTFKDFYPSFMRLSRSKLRRIARWYSNFITQSSFIKIEKSISYMFVRALEWKGFVLGFVLSGLAQVKKDKSPVEENAVSSSSTQEKQSPVNSNDLEWDNDFVSAEIDTSDTAQLLAAELAIQKTASHWRHRIMTSSILVSGSCVKYELLLILNLLLHFGTNYFII